ncbi:MAG: TlyA family RNA methyltransferase [Deltaproteobacteria bacterium]|nr:TlyA family RNA methyltransferase [Deltaproteobacteria bacterium]
MKARADQRLVDAGLARDLTEARAQILAGTVFISLGSGGERRVEKAGERVPGDASLRVAGAEHPFVSRGGIKLAHALDQFGVDPRGVIAADIGVSTGGFTDCLLMRGALRVHAVDVGYGQIAWKLRNDPRVVLYERTNARHLPLGHFGEPIDLMVIDVSFVGLSQLLPALIPHLGAGAKIIALVKPQFELPKESVGAGGIVQDAASRAEAVAAVRRAARAAGWEASAAVESPIRGAEGNVEYLLLLGRSKPEPAGELLGDDAAGHAE